MMVVGVNLTTAIYNLIPVPPMAMGYLVSELMPEMEERTRTMLFLVGPYLVLALALAERLTHQAILSPYFDPIIRAIYTYIVGS
jgi:hypothetical protein